MKLKLIHKENKETKEKKKEERKNAKVMDFLIDLH